LDQEELMMGRKKLLELGVGLALVVVWVIAAIAGESETPKAASTNSFFAFDNGAGYGSVPPEEQAKMLKELGYAGIGYTGARQIPAMLKALDAEGLTMFSIYVDVCLTPEKGKPPHDPALKTAIEQLRGRDTLVWLPIGGGRPSSTALDDRAVAVIREIADAAKTSGLRVALYPHLGNYVERVEDAVRLVKKADRKNVGATFNLCHFLKVDHEKNLERRLKEARPCLFAVSINGADGGNTNRMEWDRLIQPLDRGSFDVGRVLKALRQLDYTGPIGLQCYAIPGDRRANLARSMKAWRSLSARVEAER
jgi:sugar phosphate isomerase/epimerase